MRILYLAGADLSLPQGQAVHIRRLTEALEARGHAVRLLVHRPARPPAWTGPSGGMVEVARLRVPRAGHLAVELALARAAARELRRFTPDVWLVRQELYTFAPLLVRSGRVPLVVESNAAPAAVMRAAGAPGWRVALARAAEARLLRRADVVGAVTSALARMHIEGHGLDPGRVRVVPNGTWVPPLRGDEAVALRRRHGIADEHFLLVFAGNLNHVQALEVVLEAMAGLPSLPLRLRVIGEGARRRTLEARCARLGLSDRVRFLGGMSEEEAARHAQAAQLLLAPYRLEAYEALGGEASALKVLQGLACDRPLLAGRVRGLEFLESLGANRAPGQAPSPIPRAGELVDAGDPAAWAVALRRRVEEWERGGRKLRDWPWPEGEGEGRRYVLAERTWDHAAALWEAVFACAATGRTRQAAGSAIVSGR